MIIRARPLPTIGRYLLREFARNSFFALAAFVGLYLCIDFFERFPTFLRHEAEGKLIIFYFVLKLPLIIAQMVPAAALSGALLSLGTLSKGNEIMAMRACGISLWQIGTPIAGICLVLSLATLVWNEHVVPAATTRAHHIEKVQIKNKQFEGHLGEWGIWYQSLGGFTNVEHFDAVRQQLDGVTIYQMDGEFRLNRVVFAHTAHWTGAAWQGEGISEVVFTDDGAFSARPLANGPLPTTETPESLATVHRDTDDLSFSALRRQIRDLRSKGVDATSYTVDLWLKTAIPFVPLVMVLLAVPLASRHGRQSGMAASIALVLVLGFSYWIVLGITASLGRSGVLSPLLAAWTPNLFFGVIGAIFFLSAE